MSVSKIAFKISFKFDWLEVSKWRCHMGMNMTSAKFFAYGLNTALQVVSTLANIGDDMDMEQKRTQ